MMFHVKWFYLVPCLVNLVLGTAFGSAAGRAMADGDWARVLVLLALTGLCWANCAACGMMASR